jgi:hypothetical protein
MPAPGGIHPDLAAAFEVAATSCHLSGMAVTVARRVASAGPGGPDLTDLVLEPLARLRCLWNRRPVLDHVQVPLTRAGDAGFGAVNAHYAAYDASQRVWFVVRDAIDEANVRAGRRTSWLACDPLRPSPVYGPAAVRRHFQAVCVALAAADWPDWAAVRVAVEREAMRATVPPAGEPSGPRNRGGAPRKALSPMDKDILSVWRADSPHPKPQAIVDRLKPNWPGIKMSHVRVQLKRERQRERTGTFG